MAPYPYQSGHFQAVTISDHSFTEDAMDDEDQLKVEINTFVWMHAPAEMPLGKADELACRIFLLILDARKTYRSRPAVPVEDSA